ncbi:glutamic acid-rich protein-like [Papaver somniferum]|uniref:glutamic acid-rich protein-like n=1 Tax=Papaver somniferum TaxID=3469 RepID=UPI000E6FC13C|nr:glutamic acid-rich protein-like [Papaver somniferum]
MKTRSQTRVEDEEAVSAEEILWRFTNPQTPYDVVQIEKYVRDERQKRDNHPQVPGDEPDQQNEEEAVLGDDLLSAGEENIEDDIVVEEPDNGNQENAVLGVANEPKQENEDVDDLSQPRNEEEDHGAPSEVDEEDKDADDLLESRNSEEPDVVSAHGDEENKDGDGLLEPRNAEEQDGSW